MGNPFKKPADSWLSIDHRLQKQNVIQFRGYVHLCQRRLKADIPVCHPMTPLHWLSHVDQYEDELESNEPINLPGIPEIA